MGFGEVDGSSCVNISVYYVGVNMYNFRLASYKKVFTLYQYLQELH